MTSSEPNRNSGFPILPGELNLRFGCGFTFGLVMGFLCVLKWVSRPTWLEVALWVGGAAVICGLLARRLGDEFWRDPKNWEL